MGHRVNLNGRQNNGSVKTLIYVCVPEIMTLAKDWWLLVGSLVSLFLFLHCQFEFGGCNKLHSSVYVLALSLPLFLFPVSGALIHAVQDFTTSTHWDNNNTTTTIFIFQRAQSDPGLALSQSSGTHLGRSSAVFVSVSGVCVFSFHCCPFQQRLNVWIAVFCWWLQRLEAVEHTHTHTRRRTHTPIIPPIPTAYPRGRSNNKAICCSTVLSSSRPQWAACLLQKHAILSALMDGDGRPQWVTLSDLFRGYLTFWGPHTQTHMRKDMHTPQTSIHAALQRPSIVSCQTVRTGTHGVMRKCSPSAYGWGA